MKRERIAYLDFLRCLAIFFVIILHAMIPILSTPDFYAIPSWYVCLAQNSFNRTGVSLFFMLSGYLMLSNPKTLDIGNFYRKNLPKLGIPLLCWNVIYYVASVVRTGETASGKAFLALLLNQGSSYHMWFVYTLLGIYLFLPFLKRIVDSCTPNQQLILLSIILFPTTIRPLLNTIQPIYIFLFDPLIEGYVGYVLLGYWLGNWRPDRQKRVILYLLGIGGYLLGLYGNWSTASPASIPLPFNGGYTINHYLTAAAIFVLVRTIFEQKGEKLAPLSKVLAKGSDLVFGVYWVHVLVLDMVTDVIGSEMTILSFVFLRVSLTTVISFGAAAGLARIPGFRKLLL